MNDIRKFIDTLSENDAKDLLEEAACHSEWLTDRLAELAAKANRKDADILYERVKDKVRDAFDEETDIDHRDFDGCYSLYGTGGAIESGARALLKADLIEKALDFIDECEAELPSEFKARCESNRECYDDEDYDTYDDYTDSDLETLFESCEAARARVFYKSNRATMERLYAHYADIFLKENRLEKNFKDFFNTLEFRTRKYDLLQDKLASLDKAGKLGSALGQEVLILIAELMDKLKKPHTEVKKFENRYASSGKLFAQTVKERCLKRGETASAIELLEKEEKSPAVCRELIELYKKYDEPEKAVGTYQTLIRLVLDKPRFRDEEDVVADLKAMHEICDENLWKTFAEELLEKKETPTDAKLYLCESIESTPGIASVLLTDNPSVLLENCNRFKRMKDPFEPVWRLKLLHYLPLLAKDYSDSVVKAYEWYLSYLERNLQPDYYEEAAQAVADLKKLPNGEALCRKWSERWHEKQSRRRNLMMAMRKRGV